MIKGFAFDLEGTVVDVESAHHEGHLAAAKDAGVTLTLDEALTKKPHFIGGPDEKIAEEIWELSDKKSSPEEILKKDKQHYEEFLKSLEIKPRPGFLEFCKAFLALPPELFGGEKPRIAIGSLTPNIQAEVLLARSGLLYIFPREVIVLRNDVQNVKPAPDVFLETAKRMDMSPEEQLVFEDSPRGIQAALKAGSPAIGVPVYNRPDTVKALIDAGASRIITQWSEITPQELIRELNK